MAKKVEMITTKELRTYDNISQSELAERMMVSVEEVKKWERMQPNLPGSVFMTLALSFGVPIHDILGAKGVKIDPYSDQYNY